ncbi:hypothetical protein WDW37_12575 [Bdellovibrionota bacterium FG-1]
MAQKSITKIISRPTLRLFAPGGASAHGSPALWGENRPVHGSAFATASAGLGSDESALGETLRQLTGQSVPESAKAGQTAGSGLPPT